MTCTGEWEISASISRRVGRYDVQYTQTGSGGRAVYHVKGMCTQYWRPPSQVFLSISFTICMFLCIEQPLIHKDLSQAKRVTT